MTTLKDVAREANVSQMTVSRVINHPEQVTEELKQLVYDAMKTLILTLLRKRLRITERKLLSL